MSEEIAVPAEGNNPPISEAQPASSPLPEHSDCVPASAPKGTLHRVSLCRAFKERSRLAQKISESINLIQEENSILEGGVRSVDIRREFKRYMALSEKLIALRQTISRANAGIAGKLVELAEVKNLLTQLKRIPTNEGPQSSYSKADVKVAEIRKSELFGKIKSLRGRIHALQDEIDEFNARTYIEFEF